MSTTTYSHLTRYSVGAHTMPTFDSDKPMTVLGVPGRLTHRTTKDDSETVLWFRQRWISEARPISGYAVGATLRVEMRFDDDPSNGHNTFAITAEVREPNVRDIATGGCLHDDIAIVFPELAPLIKWHLVSTDGPMHYIANTVYHAGDRDHNGLRKGEVRQIINGKSKLPSWELCAVDRAGNVVDGKPAKYVDSAELPADPDIRLLYRPWNKIGEGKDRDLAAARSTAVWPDATDEQLSVEPAELRTVLTARLPKLLQDFRVDMDRIGFLWSPADATVAR